MKKAIIAVCFLCLTVSYSLAGDIIILPDKFQSSGHSSDGMDSYIISDDRGQTRSVTVIQLDEDMYVATDSNGNSTTIYKPDFSNSRQWE